MRQYNKTLSPGRTNCIANWDNTGKALAAQTDWEFNDREGAVGTDLSSNNAGGFTALPGGSRYLGGGFQSQGSYGYWWSATESSETSAYVYYLWWDYQYLDVTHGAGHGFSVRLVRDLARPE